MNVLVTGANGFLGKTMVNRLKHDSSVRILKCTRSTTSDELYEMLKISDFIYHFAGEVAPTSSDDSFTSSNVEFTKLICRYLSLIDRKVPIMFASTIHALNPRNSYGHSKKQAEEELRHYSNSSKAPLMIYHLPHMFGPGCKPNYNSVITTWIHNIIHGLPVNVYDESIRIEYCFSIDLASELVQLLNSEHQVSNYSIKPEIIYKTTLGAVVKMLYSIQEERFDHGDELAVKLYMTFKSYI